MISPQKWEILLFIYAILTITTSTIVNSLIHNLFAISVWMCIWKPWLIDYKPFGLLCFVNFTYYCARMMRVSVHAMQAVDVRAQLLKSILSICLYMFLYFLRLNSVYMHMEQVLYPLGSFSNLCGCYFFVHLFLPGKVSGSLDWPWIHYAAKDAPVSTYQMLSSQAHMTTSGLVLSLLSFFQPQCISWDPTLPYEKFMVLCFMSYEWYLIRKCLHVLFTKLTSSLRSWRAQGRVIVHACTHSGKKWGASHQVSYL